MKCIILHDFCQIFVGFFCLEMLLTHQPILIFSMQIEKEEQAAAEKAVGKEEFQGEWTAPAAEFAQPEVADWSEGVAVPSVPIQQFPAGKELFPFLIKLHLQPV